MAALVFVAAGLAVRAAEPAPVPAQAPAPASAPAPPAPPSPAPQPAPIPARLSDAQIRALVDQFTQLYGIPERAGAISRVIHLESRGFTAVKSKNGLYYGLCQFMPRTFKVNVEAMKQAGLLAADQTYSPMNPEHAIQVMVWMWSQGYQRQWGPARRMKLDPIRPIDLTLKTTKP